ncbi:MAG: hypothetical protein RR049_01685, partial [Angelakisella sp.]
YSKFTEIATAKSEVSLCCGFCPFGAAKLTKAATLATCNARVAALPQRKFISLLPAEHQPCQASPM